MGFAKGHQDTGYSAGLEEVATYRGLVADRALANVGFFAIIPRFEKLNILALRSIWVAIKRYFSFGPGAPAIAPGGAQP